MDALERNQLKHAEGCFSKACAACPEDQRIRAHLVQSLKKQGQYEKAISEINKILAESEDSSFLRTELGELHFLHGQYQQANRQLELAIEKNVRSPKSWFRKGQTQAKLGNHQQAVQDFYRALTYHNPTSSLKTNDIRFELADSYLKLGHQQRALTTLENIAARYPENEQPEKLVLHLGQLFSDMNLDSKAIELVQNAAKNPNATPAIFVKLSQLQHSIGDASAAQRTLQAARQRFPSDPAVRERVAEIARSEQGLVDLNR
jgi:tetratricopeptide (TPR) repeat protein